MSSERDQSKVAYEVAPKEKNTKRGMKDGNKQFGNKKMPQSEKPVKSKKKRK